jgi:hypothetical protein
MAPMDDDPAQLIFMWTSPSAHEASGARQSQNFDNELQVQHAGTRTQIAAFSPSGRSSSSPDISTRTKTAKALGLDVPSALLVAVDEVIE